MSKRASPQQLWAQPINLDLSVNTVYDEVGAALSQDGLHLIFASQRRGGLGDFDLWQIDRTLSTANFGEPRNLGPTINTLHKDTVPKLSADDSVLLYAAARIGSKGGYDVWASTHDSHWESWSEPANLDDYVNTQSHQQTPVLTGDGRTLYYSAVNLPGMQGWSDLYFSRRVLRESYAPQLDIRASQPPAPE